MTTYTRLNKNQFNEINGTCKRDFLETLPILLIKAFGPYDKGDEYKVSGEYAFKSSKGHVFTVYDWKCTSLYDPDYIKPAKFWSCNLEADFSIGSHSNTPEREVLAFKKWVLENNLDSALLSLLES